MGVIGAILGDIQGSKYENNRHYSSDFASYIKTPLEWTDEFNFTDDTVMSVALVEAVHDKNRFEDAFVKYGQMFPNAGYGPAFKGWLYGGEAYYDKSIWKLLHPNGAPKRKPYNSYGNGSAMRCSYIGEYLKNAKQKEVEELATKSAVCSHNHLEGIKGAVVETICVWLAENGASKEEILDYGKMMYPSVKYKWGCDIPTSEYRETISYDITCQGSVPVAIRCFYEAETFTELMNLICYMDCDSDTIGAMAGAIWHSMYRKCTDTDEEIVKRYLADPLYRVLTDNGVIRL